MLQCNAGCCKFCIGGIYNGWAQAMEWSLRRRRLQKEAAVDLFPLSTMSTRWIRYPIWNNESSWLKNAKKDQLGWTLKFIYIYSFSLCRVYTNRMLFYCACILQLELDFKFKWNVIFFLSAIMYLMCMCHICYACFVFVQDKWY